MSDATERPESGRIVVITGAARGIGHAATHRFLSYGDTVVAADLADAPFDELPSTGAVVAHPTDVRSSSDWQALVASCEQRFGRIDVVVNNAGIGGATAPLLDYPDDDFDHVLEVNARGTFLGMKYAAPLMKASGGGSIVNVSSVVGLGSGPNVIGYTASKHAVVGLTRTAAVELAPDIRVNAVCPSSTATRMMWDLRDRYQPDVDDESFERGFTAINPSRRFGQPEEIADVIAFLASDAASFVSGAIVPVDGGLRAQ